MLSVSGPQKERTGRVAAARGRVQSTGSMKQITEAAGGSCVASDWITSPPHNSYAKSEMKLYLYVHPERRRPQRRSCRGPLLQSEKAI